MNSSMQVIRARYAASRFLTTLGYTPSDDYTSFGRDLRFVSKELGDDGAPVAGIAIFVTPDRLTVIETDYPTVAGTPNATAAAYCAALATALVESPGDVHHAIDGFLGLEQSATVREMIRKITGTEYRCLGAPSRLLT